MLSTPLSEARAAVEYLSGPEVWNGLLTEFAAELREVERAAGSQVDNQASTELDDTGVPWVPHLGGRGPLRAELEHAARTGRWDRSRHAGRSEARMAVLTACAACGWRLAEVEAAVADSSWSGLARLYERPSEPARMTRLMPIEWRKAIAFAAEERCW